MCQARIQKDKEFGGRAMLEMFGTLYGYLVELVIDRDKLGPLALLALFPTVGAILGMVAYLSRCLVPYSWRLSYYALYLCFGTLGFMMYFIDVARFEKSLVTYAAGYLIIVA